MATTKTLTPTNQAITLAAFTEKPDNRTNVTNDDKLADAVNALNSNMSTEVITLSSVTISTGTADGNLAGYKILDLFNIRIIVHDATLADNVVLGQIEDSRLRPQTNVYLRVYDYNNGKPVNGSLYLNTNGTFTYYGDQLSNKTIMIYDCIVVKG